MTINWTTAAAASTADYDEAIQKAGATIIMGVDDILADPSIARPTRLALLQQLGATLANKEAFFALLTGQVHTSAKALGAAGSPDPDDLQDQLDAANTTINELKADRAALEEALVVLDVSRLMPDGHYTKANIRTSATAKLTDKVNAAKASVMPANFVDKAVVKPKLTELETAINAIKTTRMSPSVDGLTAVKTKLTEAVNLVS